MKKIKPDLSIEGVKAFENDQAEQKISTRERWINFLTVALSHQHREGMPSREQAKLFKVLELTEDAPANAELEIKDTLHDFIRHAIEQSKFHPAHVKLVHRFKESIGMDIKEDE